MHPSKLELLKGNKIIIGISEVSKITGISTRQLRYWEKKGYIHSVDRSKRFREFSLDTVIKIEHMKDLLEEGFTLVAAYEKVDKKMKLFKKMKHLFINNYEGIIELEDGKAAIDFGYFNANEEEHLYFIFDESTDKSYFQAGNINKKK